ncbi:MAG TPA: hypothetical protein VFV99_10850, partial [Kofleriaceae bacterium]|nr:hypothetical protein [Kofleriaceae bacterium]
KSSETMKEIEFAQRNHSAFQYWDVTDIGGEIYTLRNEGSGKFMSFGFGSHVKQSGDQDQHTHWRLLPV